MLHKISLILASILLVGTAVRGQDCDVSGAQELLAEIKFLEDGIGRLGYVFVQESDSGGATREIKRSLRHDPPGEPDFEEDLKKLEEYRDLSAAFVQDFNTCGDELRSAGIDAVRVMARMEADRELIEERIGMASYEVGYARLLQLTSQLAAVNETLLKGKVGLADLGEGRFEYQLFISGAPPERRAAHVITAVKQLNCLIEEASALTDGEHVEYVDEVFGGRKKVLIRLLKVWEQSDIESRTRCD